MKIVKYLMRNVCYSVKYQSFNERYINSNIKCHIFWVILRFLFSIYYSRSGCVSMLNLK